MHGKSRGILYTAPPTADERDDDDAVAPADD
jgi:hypothetical protein